VIVHKAVIVTGRRCRSRIGVMELGLLGAAGKRRGGSLAARNRRCHRIEVAGADLAGCRVAV
jgi:hypothetical protein